MRLPAVLRMRESPRRMHHRTRLDCRRPLLVRAFTLWFRDDLRRRVAIADEVHVARAVVGSRAVLRRKSESPRCTDQSFSRPQGY